jgi:gluconokinase
MPTAIILMGVSGCGKTSVGQGLSAALGWPFYDGDDFMPQANIDKMANGIPLDDADRQPWLETLHRLIVESLESGRSLIVASSALKARYRSTLRGERQEVRFVHLAGDFDLIYGRIQQRSGHYMKAEMLHSQFRDLELPKDAQTVPIDKPVDQIVDEIIQQLGLPADPPEY